MACALIAMMLVGCAAHAGVTVETSVYPEEQIHIPPGHMPPPGECRIWFPDLPPGHQPPPGDCYDLEHEVPAGAVLVRG